MNARAEHVVFLSIPGLRVQDVPAMPHLRSLMGSGGSATLVPSFPCVTWPVQANMLTGKRPSQHGVVANGFYWRDSGQVEMWTADNGRIAAPQLWDVLREQHRGLTSAAWFPMLSKGCGADYVCMPAPVHNPDGSESLWCYTKPSHLYGELRDRLGHFPLQHFWGPLAGIPSSAWIVDSAVYLAHRDRPNFFYLYLPHLDYAAQRAGPDSLAAETAVRELDGVLGRLAAGFGTAYRDREVVYVAASEYVITPVRHVVYPNRVLRSAGFLGVQSDEGGELLDLKASRAWALVDHQFSHVFVRDRDARTMAHLASLFRGQAGIAEVLVGSDLEKYGIEHERSGEIVLVSSSNSWQAYYWWLDDARAPRFARTVDIHTKPGYDPVELCFDPTTKAIPLDATLIKGSHGAPAVHDGQRGVIMTSRQGAFHDGVLHDVDVFDIVLGMLGQ